MKLAPVRFRRGPLSLRASAHTGVAIRFPPAATFGLALHRRRTASGGRISTLPHLPFPGRAWSPRPANGAAAEIPACLLPPPAAAGRHSPSDGTALCPGDSSLTLRMTRDSRRAATEPSRRGRAGGETGRNRTGQRPSGPRAHRVSSFRRRRPRLCPWVPLFRQAPFSL